MYQFVIYVFISLYIAKISIIFVSSTVDGHLDFQLVTIMNYTSRIDRNLSLSGAIPARGMAGPRYWYVQF